MPINNEPLSPVFAQQPTIAPPWVFSTCSQGKLIINPEIPKWETLQPSQQESVITQLVNYEMLYNPAVDLESLKGLLKTIPPKLADIILALYEKRFDNAAANSRRIALNNGIATCILANMINLRLIQASEDDFACVALEIPNTTKHYEQASVLYRKAATLSCNVAITNLAGMIWQGFIKASDDDFTCASLEKPNTNNHYEQALVLYRKASTLGCSLAIASLAGMIRQGFIKASDDDFTCAGLEKPNITNHHEQAAVLFRRAATLGYYLAIPHLAYMIWKGFIKASDDDFTCAGLEKPNTTNRDEQAAMLFRRAATLGCYGAIYNLAAMIYNRSIPADITDYASLNLNLISANTSQTLSTILYFRAAISCIIEQTPSNSFINMFNRLNKDEQFTCLHAILPLLITIPKAGMSESLFQSLVKHKKSLTQYLLNPVNQQQWETQKKQLINNNNALGCVINYSRRRQEVMDPGITKSSQFFSTPKQQPQAKDDMHGSRLIGDCDL